MAVDIKVATLETDRELVNQYIAMRAKLTIGKSDLPNAPIRGDSEAVFLLGVEDGKVRAGLRLNPVGAKNGGWSPADKVDGAKLEAIYADRPDIAVLMRAGDEKHKALYVDGIFSDMGILEIWKGATTQKKMLKGLADYGKSQNYAMVYCFPYKDNAEPIQRFFDKLGVASVNLGAQPYKGHDGSERGLSRRLLVFSLDPSLMQHVRSAGSAMAME